MKHATCRAESNRLVRAAHPCFGAYHWFLLFLLGCKGQRISLCFMTGVVLVLMAVVG